jgi:outer membrane protein W
MKTRNKMMLAAIALLALAMPIQMMAQVEVTKVWSIGPEVGVSLSKYGRDADPNNFKPGIVTGLAVTYSIINTFGITGKVLYHQKGATFQEDDIKQTLGYIEIPVVGRFFLNKEGQFRPNIFVGPSIGFLTGAKNKVGSNDPERMDTFKDSFNTVDLGVTGGMGCNIRILNETYLVLDARYTHGGSDITKANADVNNNNFAFTAGVNFGL